MSGAPGFWIGNVIVMPGVPSIMQAMLDEVAPKLKIGARMLSETVRADVREGDIGMLLGEIAKANPKVASAAIRFSISNTASTRMWCCAPAMHRSLTDLLYLIAGGIVGGMPLSRTQQQTADLFQAAGAKESCRAHTPARLTAAVLGGAEKLSSRHVLPRDLSNALKQLDDEELDRLYAATRHELQRRGRLLTSTPVIRPTTRVGTEQRASDQSTTTEESPERREPEEPNVALAQGQVNAVRAALKAGITPSRIARQFGISQSDVRKVLASESRRAGKGR